MITIVALTNTFSKKSVADVVNPTEFKDLPNQPIYCDMIFGMEAMVMLLLVARIFCVFRLNLYFDLIISTFGTAFHFLVAFAFYFIAIVCCCAMITQVLWGTIAMQFTEFWRALFNVFLTFGGNMKYSTWLHKSSSWSYVYFVLVFLWVAFLFPFVFIGIYLESYRITALELGYPETCKKKKWGPKNYLAWVLACCPNSLRHRLGVDDETLNPTTKKTQ